MESVYCVYDMCPTLAAAGNMWGGQIYKFPSIALLICLGCLIELLLILSHAFSMKSSYGSLSQRLKVFAPVGKCPFQGRCSVSTVRKTYLVFATEEASSSIGLDVPDHGLLSNIEELLGRLYMRCWQDDILRLRAIISEKTWIAFDLDDTLHEFRLSSGTATDAVLRKISALWGTPMMESEKEYSRVLKEKTANAFSDGKPSFDYRRERFGAVLSQFSIPQNDKVMPMEDLLDLYETTLMASLKLKCGALGLLSSFNNMGKKTVVITEGPQDTQVRTIRALGISQYIDFIATTNHFRVTKTNGLFPRLWNT